MTTIEGCLANELRDFDPFDLTIPGLMPLLLLFVYSSVAGEPFGAFLMGLEAPGDVVIIDAALLIDELVLLKEVVGLRVMSFLDFSGWVCCAVALALFPLDISTGCKDLQDMDLCRLLT